MASLLSGNEASDASVPSIYPDQNTNDTSPAFSKKSYEPPPTIGLNKRGKALREYLPLGSDINIHNQKALMLGKKYYPYFEDKKVYRNVSKTNLPQFEWVTVGQTQMGWVLGDL